MKSLRTAPACSPRPVRSAPLPLLALIYPSAFLSSPPRHHTNPVGREWKWQMDAPDQIVEGALSEHRSMVKQMRGVPGVLPQRLEEGMAPRHCALSLARRRLNRPAPLLSPGHQLSLSPLRTATLTRAHGIFRAQVGEPIMYPEINTLLGLLHGKRISTFLVTNAQFPDAIKNLKPITQLYVSVDAATPDTLKAIDRPLFSDFWERFVGSLSALKEKRQRTVYRLTLVAGWNITEAGGYADLVALGEPDFIEIKGVTYCGAVSGSFRFPAQPRPRQTCKKCIRTVRRLTSCRLWACALCRATGRAA